MSNTIARYAITTGLSGCYMPNASFGPIYCSTRRELASVIRDEIDAQEFPLATFGQANIRELWGFIRRNGSSVAHFSITHGAYEIAFHGLTEDEAGAMEEEND